MIIKLVTIEYNLFILDENTASGSELISYQQPFNNFELADLLNDNLSTSNHINEINYGKLFVFILFWMNFVPF